MPQYWHGGKGASSDHRIGVVRVEDKGGNDSSRRQQLHGLSWFMVHHGAHRHLLWRQEAVNDDGQSVRMDLVAPKFVLILTWKCVYVVSTGNLHTQRFLVGSPY